MPDRRTISGSVSVSLVEDGVTYQIEASVGSVTIASNASGATLTSTLRFYSKEGAADRAALSCYSCVFKKSGSTYTRVTSEYNRAYNSKQSSGTISNLSVGTSVNAVVVCVYAYPSQAHEGYLCEFEIPVYKSGDKGDKGDTNKRMPYYAGKLSEVKGTVVIANDYSTPYVDVETGTADHPNCYVYVGSNTSSGKTYPTTAQAYSISSEWEIMTSDFKWLVTQAVFANFAKLASAIMSGDYLYSQKGLMSSRNGFVSSSQYDLFVPTDPNAENAIGRFRPRLWMNLKKGLICTSHWVVQFFHITSDNFASFFNTEVGSSAYFADLPTDFVDDYGANIQMDYCGVSGHFVIRYPDPPEGLIITLSNQMDQLGDPLKHGLLTLQTDTGTYGVDVGYRQVVQAVAINVGGTMIWRAI